MCKILTRFDASFCSSSYQTIDCSQSKESEQLCFEAPMSCYHHCDTMCHNFMNSVYVIQEDLVGYFHPVLRSEKREPNQW